jgi:hypothetical protein
MFALGMVLGNGRPSYRVEINVNRNQWDLLYDAPSVANLGFPINLFLVIAPGVTVESTLLGYEALAIRTLYEGSSVYLINQGTIRGYSTDAHINFTTAVRFLQDNCTLNITNGSGFIYAGYMAGTPGYGYAVRYNATSVLSWASGSSRIAGTVYQG